MEEETEESKKSILQRIIAFFARLIEKLKNWWAKFRGIVEKAKAAANEAKFSKAFKYTGVKATQHKFKTLTYLTGEDDVVAEQETDLQPYKLDIEEIEISSESAFNKQKEWYINI